MIQLYHGIAVFSGEEKSFFIDAFDNGDFSPSSEIAEAYLNSIINNSTSFTIHNDYQSYLINEFNAIQNNFQLDDQAKLYILTDIKTQYQLVEYMFQYQDLYTPGTTTLYGNWWSDWGKCASVMIGGAVTGAVTGGELGFKIGAVFASPVKGAIIGGTIGAIGGAIGAAGIHPAC